VKVLDLDLCELLNIFIFYSATAIKVPSKPRSKLMIAVDVLRRYMAQFHYGIFDGSVYVKAPDAKYTFVFCSNVHDFLHHILGNAEVADHIASHVSQLSSLLSVRACRLIKPIQIDYNFIEVLPLGTCFNIELKRFELDPKDLKGVALTAFYFIFCLNY